MTVRLALWWERNEREGGRVDGRPIPFPPESGARVARQRCPILRSGPGCCSRRLARSPLLFEFLGREVSQGGVNAFDVIDVVEEAVQALGRRRSPGSRTGRPLPP